MTIRDLARDTHILTLASELGKLLRDAPYDVASEALDALLGFDDVPFRRPERGTVDLAGALRAYDATKARLEEHLRLAKPCQTWMGLYSQAALELRKAARVSQLDEITLLASRATVNRGDS